MRVVSAFFALLLLFGCGYKPASHYTRSVLGEKIFADIQIDINDPQSGIVALDSLNEAIVYKFGSRLVAKNEATSTITITKATQSFTPLQRDANGFVVMYRGGITMSVIVTSENINRKNFTVSGFYDFAVTPSHAVLSDSEKTLATREAALKALDELIPRVVLLGR